AASLVAGDMPAKFNRSRRLVADQQRHRSLGDPQPPDPGDGQRLPRRPRVVSGSDKSQLMLGDREDSLRRLRERAADVRRKPAAASLGSKLAASAKTTPRIPPSHGPISPH